MGLDMFLYAKKPFYKYLDPDSEKIVEQINKIDIPGRGEMRVHAVECEAMYWRKANQIHKWFVDNVQNGTDDCGTYEVEITQLQSLVDTCKKVLRDKTKAYDLLPPQKGFFFGSTEIDECYSKDLEETVEQLTKILETPNIKQWWFTYHSSW